MAKENLFVSASDEFDQGYAEASAVLAALYGEIAEGKKIVLEVGRIIWVPILRKKVVLSVFILSAISSLLTSCVGSVRAQVDDEEEVSVAKNTLVIERTPMPTSLPEISETMTPVILLPVVTPDPSPTIEPSATYSAKLRLETLTAQEKAFLESHEIWRGRKDKKVILMTYDDGGREGAIRGMMGVYEKHGAKTTFFVTGEWVVKHPDLVKEMVERGFEVGCHGWDHSAMTQLATQDAHNQMKDFLKTMEEVVPGYNVKYIRFPYGARNNYLKKIAAEYGLQSVMWSSESGGNTDRTFEFATRNLQPGEIVLSHSTRWYDVLEAERIIQYLQSQGYDLVTISEGIDPGDVYMAGH